MEIAVVRDILNANDQVAAENRSLLAARGVTAVNIMASPGAGQTSVGSRTTAERLRADLRPGVVEGDTGGGDDRRRCGARGGACPRCEINTGGRTAIPGLTVIRWASALPRLPLDKIGVLFIENVGNLVCPAEFDLGEIRGGGRWERAGGP